MNQALPAPTANRVAPQGAAPAGDARRSPATERFAAANGKTPNHARSRRAIVVTLCFGVVLAIDAFLLASSYESRLEWFRFSAVAEDRTLAMRAGVGRYMDALDDLRAFVVAGRGGIDRGVFQAVATRILGRTAGIQALEWIPRVPAEEREAYELAARRDGFAAFRINEAATGGARVAALPRSEYYPVYFLAPVEGNEAAIGYDLASEPLRRATLEKARDTGVPAATDEVHLVQETGRSAGLLIFMPVFRDGAPHATLEERRRNLLGLVLGVFRITEVIEDILHANGSSRNLDMYFLDRASRAENRLLYSRLSPAHGDRSEDFSERRLKASRHSEGSIAVADRQWVFAAVPATASRLWTPLAAFVAVLLVTGTTAMQLATSLRRADERQSATDRLLVSLRQTIEAVANTVEMRDPYTAGHQRRVAALASAIGEEMGLSEDRNQGLALAGTVHDLGKISIPSEILSKPGRLSALQLELVRMHPQSGYDILKGVDFPWPIPEILLQHHERLDGSGYPRGLKDGSILEEAKILAVADVVEAMMSHRPYRAALGTEAALEEIEKGSGRLYDPGAVAACARLFREKGFAF
jgi:HD-GYP domain-containing protein (c-di-GMP phosphodiesterase class II)